MIVIRVHERIRSCGAEIGRVAEATSIYTLSPGRGSPGRAPEIGELRMAHKESLQNKEMKAAMPSANHVYTVSTNVGYGYKNMSEDVRLVQFFLNCSIESLKDDWHDRPAKLATDGIFGGKTWAAIKAFQKIAITAVADGMISPVDGIKIETPKHKMVYTMYLLNWYYWMDKSEFYNDIRRDPRLPGELREYLSSPLPNLL